MDTELKICRLAKEVQLITCSTVNFCKASNSSFQNFKIYQYFSHVSHLNLLERQIAGPHYLCTLEQEQQLYRQTSQAWLAQAVMNTSNYK
jgi:hypothetical protein